MPKPQRNVPARPVHEWERVCFACPPDLKITLEGLVKAFGEGQGAFLRYLIRQEAKHGPFAQK